MNNAHSTHFTDDPEDGITYVLRGWPSKPGETEAKHDVTLKDMKVWNADQRPRLGPNAARINGNSIFIFAIADLRRHLGHLHHRLTKDHLDELGRIDVLMVPIDGSYDGPAADGRRHQADPAQDGASHAPGASGARSRGLMRTSATSYYDRRPSRSCARAAGEAQRRRAGGNGD
jgi:hypothetical protein